MTSDDMVDRENVEIEIVEVMWGPGEQNDLF